MKNVIRNKFRKVLEEKKSFWNLTRHTDIVMSSNKKKKLKIK